MIDTLKLSKGLQAAGFTQPQSEKVAEALQEAQTDYVTRDYLDAKLEALKSELTEKINGLKDRIVWPVVISVGIIGIITWVLQVFGTTLGPIILKAISGH